MELDDNELKLNVQHKRQPFSTTQRYKNVLSHFFIQEFIKISQTFESPTYFGIHDSYLKPSLTFNIDNLDKYYNFE